MFDLAPWLQVTAALSPAAAVLAASIAAIIAWRGNVRAKRADDEEKFWHRLTWSVDAAMSDNAAMSTVGLELMYDLIEADETDIADIQLVLDLSQAVEDHLNSVNKARQESKRGLLRPFRRRSTHTIETRRAPIE